MLTKKEGIFRDVILSEAKDLRGERSACQRLEILSEAKDDMFDIPRYFLNVHNRGATG